MLGYICLNKENSYIKKKFKINSVKLLDINNSFKIDVLINDSCKKVIDEKKNEKYVQKYTNKQVKFANKIIRKLEKNNVTQVVFEDEFYKKHSITVNEIYSSNIEVITGDILYEKMIYNIFEYILSNNKNIELKEINLGIIINTITYNRLSFIRKISDRVKGITILTDNTEKFDNLYAETLSENGLSIKLTNNYKSGIKNCNILVNFDIDNEKLGISNYNNCIFINFSNKICKVRKSFKGIVINDIDISIDKNVLLNYIDLGKFNSMAIAESLNIDPKNLIIKDLIGIKNNIDTKEIQDFRIMKKKK